MKPFSTPLRKILGLVLVMSFFGASAPMPASAQAAAPAPAKKAMTVDDYSLWRTISDQALSADGKWLAYVLELTNVLPGETKPVLHIVNLETRKDTTVNDATAPVFSPDSRWIAYQVDPGAAQRARQSRVGSGGSGNAPSGNGPSSQPTPGQTGPAPGQPGQPGPRGAGTPPIPPRRVELRDLALGAVRSWQDIGTFAFAPTSSHLVLRRRGGEAAAPSGRRGGGMPPQAPAAPGSATAPAGTRGQDAILLDLRTGRFQLLGSVGDYVFNRPGTLLAYTVDAAVKDGNGLFVFDTRNGRMTPLDNDAKNYNRLAWNDEGTALAVLKGTEVEKMREKDNVLVAFPDVPALLKDGASAPVPAVLDPAKAEGFPKGWVVSDRAGLSWSEDGRRVFFGMKEQVPSPETARKSTDEAANVDVWNTGDDRVQSLQMVRAEQDRNFTFRSAFDVASGKFIKLADETMRELDVAPDGEWAVGLDTRAYLRDEKALPAADYYRVDTSTGERTLIVKGQLTGRYVFGINPHGTHFLYWKDGHHGLRPRRGDVQGPRRGQGRLHRHRIRPSRDQAVLRHRRLYERRPGRHRQPPLRPVARAARRLRAQEPDERSRDEERDPLPPPPRRAARPDPAAPGSGPAAFDLAKPQLCPPTANGRRSRATTSWPAGRRRSSSTRTRPTAIRSGR